MIFKVKLQLRTGTGREISKGKREIQEVEREEAKHLSLLDKGET